MSLSVPFAPRKAPVPTRPGLQDLVGTWALELSSRRGVRSAGWLRVGLGTAGLVAPSLLPRSLGVDSAAAARQTYAVRMASGRDLALGLGLLEALRHGGRLRPWVLAMLIADATDAVAFTAAASKRQVDRPRGGLAAVAALLGVASDLGGLRYARTQGEGRVQDA